MSFSDIKKLHADDLFSSQDAYFSKHYSYDKIQRNKLKYIGTSEDYSSIHDDVFVIHMNKPVRNLENKTIVAKNLRLCEGGVSDDYPLTDYKKYVREIELEYGGSRFDRVHPKIFASLQYLYGIDDETIIPFHMAQTNGIPISSEQNIALRVRLNKDKFLSKLVLTYDLYEIISKTLNKNDDYFMFKITFCGEEAFKKREPIKRCYPYWAANDPSFYIILTDCVLHGDKLYVKLYDTEVAFHKIKTIDGAHIFEIAKFDDYENVLTTTCMYKDPVIDIIKSVKKVTGSCDYDSNYDCMSIFYVGLNSYVQSNGRIGLRFSK